MDYTECEGCQDFNKLEECGRKVTGLPDWGPEDDRRCYACGEPVGENLYCIEADYTDPLAAVLGKCEVCEAPRYEVLGHCPACKGPVYEFADHFGCYNTFSGTCDFRIPVDRMEELEISPFYINMKWLLDGGLEINHLGQGFEHYLIILNRSHEWDIVAKEGHLPAFYERGQRTLIGSPVGKCLECGHKVIDRGDRFACSEAGCDFVIEKIDIFNAMSLHTVKLIHDIVILNDEAISGHIKDLLSLSGKTWTTWHDGDGTLYEYYDLVLVKEGGKWIFQVTWDDPELKACAREGYRKLREEWGE